MNYAEPMIKTTSINPDYNVVLVGTGFCGFTLGIKVTELGLGVNVFDSCAIMPITSEP